MTQPPAQYKRAASPINPLLLYNLAVFAADARISVRNMEVQAPIFAQARELSTPKKVISKKKKARPHE
jgi:hypothetical protein